FDSDAENRAHLLAGAYPGLFGGGTISSPCPLSASPLPSGFFPSLSGFFPSLSGFFPSLSGFFPSLFFFSSCLVSDFFESDFFSDFSSPLFSPDFSSGSPEISADPKRGIVAGSQPGPNPAASNSVSKSPFRSLPSVLL